MPTCWRCGGGKTITVTTTGTHVLPCPTCGGSGQLPEPQREQPVPATVTRAEYPKDGMATDHPGGKRGAGRPVSGSVKDSLGVGG